MPLIKSKSKKAFSKNVATEMDAGKPQKQALAIAYDIKRRNSKKKMADGGMVAPLMKEDYEDDADSVADRIINRHKKSDEDDTLDGLGEDTLFAADGGMIFEDEPSYMKNGTYDPMIMRDRQQEIFDENVNDPIEDVTYHPEAPAYHEESDGESVADRIRRKMRRK